MLREFLAATLLVLAQSGVLVAETKGSKLPAIRYAQNHAGQMDTDGILSPGERPNPNIDYDKAQRRGESRGDERYNNRYNDAAADKDRAIKDRDDVRGRYDFDKNATEYGEDDLYYERSRMRGWWDR